MFLAIKDVEIVIKIILRKFQTALNRYRERGFKSFLNLLRLKYLSGASFDDISNSVEDYLSEKAFMCRKSDKLGEGVRHAICFDVEGYSRIWNLYRLYGSCFSDSIKCCRGGICLG